MVSNCTLPADDLRPVSLVGTSSVTGVVLGNGDFWCWGDDQYGICNQPAPITTDVPVRAGRANCLTQVTTDGAAAAGLRADGTVIAWGTEGYESFGDGPGTTTSQGGIANILLPEPAVSISRPALAATRSGAVYFWGFLVPGMATVATPMLVPQITGARYVSALPLCAIDGSGALFCWGINENAVVGDGTQTNAPTPVQVLTQVLAVSGGSAINCALRTDGSVWCWGSDVFGQLGDGTTVTLRATPAMTIPMPPAVGLSASPFNVCAWTASGDLYCWGESNVGILYPSNGGSLPTKMEKLPGPVLAAFNSDYRLCVIVADEDHSVWCRGIVYQNIAEPTDGSFVRIQLPTAGASQ